MEKLYKKQNYQKRNGYNYYMLIYIHKLQLWILHKKQRSILIKFHSLFAKVKKVRDTNKQQKRSLYSMLNSLIKITTQFYLRDYFRSSRIFQKKERSKILNMQM